MNREHSDGMPNCLDGNNADLDHVDAWDREQRLEVVDRLWAAGVTAGGVCGCFGQRFDSFGVVVANDGGGRGDRTSFFSIMMATTASSFASTTAVEPPSSTNPTSRRIPTPCNPGCLESGHSLRTDATHSSTSATYPPPRPTR